MDLTELETWIKTEAGTAWLDEQKAGLISKRDQLLGELRAASSRGTELAQRAADVEKLLTEERAAVRFHVVDTELDRLLDEQRVPQAIRPSVIALLNESYGIELAVDPTGANKRKAVAKLKGADGAEKVVSLREMIDHWKLTPEAKSVRLAPISAGGGAAGGGAGGGSSAKQMARAEFESLSAQSRLDFMRAGGQISEG